MSRREALPEKDWVALADLQSVVHEVVLVRYDDEALTDGYVNAKCDELVKLAKVAMRAARKLKKKAASATQRKLAEEAAVVEEQPQEVQHGV